MKYEFRCNQCEESMDVKMEPDVFRECKDDVLSLSDMESRADAFSPCDCGGEGQFIYQFNPEGLQVSWKGLEWAGKNYKEKKYRNNRSERLGKKQKEVHYVPELKPNYKGERRESWRAAKNEAKKDNHPRLESTYDPLIEEEEQGDD